jgi:hypothetical protein
MSVDKHTYIWLQKVHISLNCISREAVWLTRESVRQDRRSDRHRQETDGSTGIEASNDIMWGEIQRTTWSKPKQFFPAITHLTYAHFSLLCVCGNYGPSVHFLTKYPKAFLARSENEENTTDRFVMSTCLPVCLFARNNSALTVQIF